MSCLLAIITMELSTYTFRPITIEQSRYLKIITISSHVPHSPLGRLAEILPRTLARSVEHSVSRALRAGCSPSPADVVAKVKHE